MNRFLNVVAHRTIDLLQERKVLLDYYEFTPQELIRLKAQNYRKLDLA